MGSMPTSEKGNNSVKYSQNFMKIYPVIYIIYQNCMPDIMILPYWFSRILFTSLLYYTKYKNQKRDIIKPNIYIIIPKVIQVIYTLDTMRMQNIMILAQWVLQIWTASSEFGTYRICEQRRFRRACDSVQSRQNLRCSLIQAVSQEEPSDRKPDP